MSLYSIIFQNGATTAAIEQALAMAREKVHKKIDEKVYMYQHFYIWGVPAITAASLGAMNKLMLEYNKQLLCAIYHIAVSEFEQANNVV